jgi:hypothetical protein
MKKTGMANMDEVIAYVMEATGCTREEAIKDIRSKVDSGKLPVYEKTHRGVQRIDKSDVPWPIEWMPIGKARELIEAGDVESIEFPMAYIMISKIGLTPQELLDELRSGRLVACGPPEVLAGEFTRALADRFSIRMTDLATWASNPKTPIAFRKKFDAAMSSRVH